MSHNTQSLGSVVPLAMCEYLLGQKQNHHHHVLLLFHLDQASWDNLKCAWLQVGRCPKATAARHRSQAPPFREKINYYFADFFRTFFVADSGVSFPPSLPPLRKFILPMISYRFWGVRYPPPPYKSA